MVKWTRALAIVDASVNAVKDVPSKEGQVKELELLLTLVQEAHQEVHLLTMTKQVGIVMQIRQQFADKKASF